MRNDSIYDAAREEFSEIESTFRALAEDGKTLKELCAELGGRLCEYLGVFDFDYKHLTVTACMENGKLILSKNVEFWNENGWDYRGINLNERAGRV